MALQTAVARGSGPSRFRLCIQKEWRRNEEVCADLFDGTVPDLNALLDNPTYLRRAVLDWFDFEMLAVLLCPRKPTRYTIATMDDNVLKDGRIGLSGTASLTHTPIQVANRLQRWRRRHGAEPATPHYSATPRTGSPRG